VAGAHGPAAGVGVLGTGGKVGGVDGPICSPGIEDPTPAGEDPTPAGEDPTPATVAGKPEKLPGVLGLVPRCVAVIDDPFSGQGTPVSGRRRPVSGHLLRAARQPGRRPGEGGRCLSLRAGGPADVPDVERHCRGSRAGL